MKLDEIETGAKIRKIREEELRMYFKIISSINECK